MPFADNATLYMVIAALKAQNIYVDFTYDEHGVLVANRLINPDLEVCSICGHYQFTHIDTEHVKSCNGQCTCPGFKA